MTSHKKQMQANAIIICLDASLQVLSSLSIK